MFKIKSIKNWHALCIIIGTVKSDTQLKDSVMIKLNKKLAGVVGLVALGATMTSAHAGTVQAGGIQWDTVQIGGIPGLTAGFDFQQWFSNGDYAVGSDGQQIVTNSSAGAIPLGVGGVLTGVGTFTNFSNGRTEGGAFSSSFCVDGNEACELTFSFGGLVATSQTTFDFSGAWLNVYYQNPPNYGWTVTETAYQDIDRIQDGDLWASFVFDDFSFDGNGLQSGDAIAGLSIVGGMQSVIDALDINDGISDIFFTAEAQFLGSDYSLAGNGNVSSVSAPSTIALFGLSLLGLGAVRRRAS